MPGGEGVLWLPVAARLQKDFMSNAMVLCAAVDPVVELIDVPTGTPVGSRISIRGDFDLLPQPEAEVLTCGTPGSIAPVVRVGADESSNSCTHRDLRPPLDAPPCR